MWCVWPQLQTQLKKKATFAWRTARRGAARVLDAPSIFVSLMWPRSPGEVITALLVNGRHAWLVRGGAGLINEQRAKAPFPFCHFYSLHHHDPPIPPPVKSVLAGLAIKFRPYERGHSFKKAIYHQPSPEDRFRVVVFFGGVGNAATKTAQGAETRKRTHAVDVG